MYSPKIDEKLIPKLYKIAKLKRQPMTKTVNEILTSELSKIKVNHQRIDSVVLKINPGKRFRDDGLCPECFAEIEHQENISTCDLCGYYECD